MDVEKIGLLVMDCDSTLSAIEGVDELAGLRGEDIRRRVEALTERAMAGEIAIDSVFAERMELIRPTAAECTAIGRRYIEQVEPEAREVIGQLSRAGWLPVILSGGFAPVIAPLAAWLGIERVAAVPLYFDKDGGYAGFDAGYPTTRNGGKPELIRQMKAQTGLSTAVMVGDGVSDLETEPEVDRFIGFGGFVERPAVRRAAPHFIYRFSALPMLLAELTNPAEQK
jgi:phosphoserine phosphatase